MKEKLFVGFLIWAFLISYSSIALADDTTYSLGANEGAKFIWKVTKCDETKLKDTLGDDWDDDGGVIEDAYSNGLKQKIVIKEIEEDAELDLAILGKHDTIGYIIDLWEWTSEAFEAEADEDEYEISWFENPDDLNDVYEKLGGFYIHQYIGGFSMQLFFLPVPVESYLADIEYRANWGAEGNSIIHNAKGEEEYVVIYTYDKSTGFLSSYVIKNEAGEVIYQIGATGLISGYEIQLFIGITCISTIGIVYFIIRKNSKN